MCYQALSLVARSGCWLQRGPFSQSAFQERGHAPQPREDGFGHLMRLLGLRLQSLRGLREVLDTCKRLLYPDQEAVRFAAPCKISLRRIMMKIDPLAAHSS